MVGIKKSDFETKKEEYVAPIASNIYGFHCLAGFNEHLKDRYRNAVRRVQPANVQEVTADAMQNLSR